MNGMSKREMAKTLMVGIAHLTTGVALIIGILIVLGPLIDVLARLYADKGMPLWASLIPLLITFVGMGWGAFFIWKSCMGAAPDIAFYLVGKTGYELLALHHISTRRRKAIGAMLVLAGLILVLAEIVPAGIKAFPEPATSVAHPSILIIGGVSMVLSIAIAGYQPMDAPSRIEDKTWHRQRQ